jgi:hypothetical protein
MYRSTDLVEFPKIDMLSRINWENSSISLFFLTGRSSISSSNFERVLTSANLISLVKNLDNRDERYSLMVPLHGPTSSLFLCVFDKLAPDVIVVEPVDSVYWQLGGQLGAPKNQILGGLEDCG